MKHDLILPVRIYKKYLSIGIFRVLVVSSNSYQIIWRNIQDPQISYNLQLTDILKYSLVFISEI
jgi:hypothetical protein